MFKNACVVCKILGGIAAIGALNWGLVGLFGFNLVTMLLGNGTLLTRLVYILVGISGIYLLMNFFRACPCNKKG